MITGFNTDIEHDGVVYHVQTEDKGLETPIILSLVYVGGAILASKRAPYEDLIATGFSDEVLAERLKRQHRLICAAINSGRIEDLKKMSPRAEQAEIGPTPSPVIVAPVIETPLVEPPLVEQVEIEPEAAEGIPVEVSRTVESTSGEEVAEVASQEEEPLAEAVTPTDEVSLEEVALDETPEEAPLEEVLPPEVPATEPVLVSAETTPAEIGAEAVEEIAASPEADEFVFELEAIPSQVWVPPPPKEEAAPEAELSDSLHDEAYTIHDSRAQSGVGWETTEGLSILLLDDTEFNAGERRILRVLVVNRKGDHEKPLSAVNVSIKILGTTFRPLIYSLKTDKEGVATVATKIPEFTSGRAAVLVRAVMKEQAAELRRVILPGK